MKSLGSLRAEDRGGCRSARDFRSRGLFYRLPIQLLPIGFWLLAFCLQPSALAQDSICARVKIEILQELTLEREAFEARMTINNGVTGMPIDNIGVDVNFADKDRQPVRASSNPNDTSALFFIRLQDGYSIPSSIAGGTSGTIKWLIIPAPGAASLTWMRSHSLTSSKRRASQFEAPRAAVIAVSSVVFPHGALATDQRRKAARVLLTPTELLPSTAWVRLMSCPPPACAEASARLALRVAANA